MHSHDASWIEQTWRTNCNVQRDDLCAGRFQHVGWVDRTGSTNTDLTEMGAANPTVPRVLFADLQTAGRGRLNRRWEQAASGGLMVSFYVPWTDASSSHLVPTALGVAIAEAISMTGRSVGLKWPNDIVVARADTVVAPGSDEQSPMLGKKLGGMLSAAVVADNALCGVVAGLGCNVSWPPLGFDALPDAVALDSLPGERVDREHLAADLIGRFDRELEAVHESGATRLLDRYRRSCVTIGQDVRVSLGDDTIVGRATDIDPSGALLVDVDGRQRRVDVGDVVHLRPDGSKG